MKKIKLLLAAFAAMVTMGVQAQLTDGTVYWIQDTGTGQFISQGANWGTQATVQEVGGLGWQVVYVSDGVYKLKNIMWNKGNNADLGLRTSDRFCDQAAGDVTLVAAEGGYKLYTTDGGYLCNNGDKNGDGVKRLGSTNDEAAATVWRFLTKSEYDGAIQAYKDAKAASYAATLGYNSVASVSALEAIITDVDQFIAQDKTSSITNPTLGSNWDGWAHAAASGSNRSEGAGIGSGCAEFWNGCGAANQTVSGLPNGLYKVEFVGTFRPKNSGEANNIASGETSSPAFVYANDAQVEFLHWIDVPAKANGRSDITVANGYNNTLYTYVTDGTLKIGIVQGCWENSYMWCPFGQFRLTYYSDQVSDEDAEALLATVPTDKMSDATQTSLNDAVSAFESNKTIANYNALTTAIVAANISVAEYATIANGSIRTDVMDGWAKSTPAGDFHVNTWSTEGNTDGSGMTTPFMENWVSAGNALGAGRIYYTFTDLNPGETYVVTARVRVFNESASGVTGATYFVGDNSKSLETFGAACVGDFATKGRFAVLSCAGTVDENGQLQFGVQLANDSPINWVAIKDVTIAEGTGAVPTAIVLNKPSTSLTTGSFETLTATITPENADDKTILWSSSDETVVSVAGGNIVALKAGTATITATAYAGDDVKASCTVTVADAAAPAYFSTTIAAEDYYIMNVATGTFLTGGNSWGTQASLIEHGIPFTAAVGEGVYTLDSHTYNDANNHFLNGTYVDGLATNLYITNLGEGRFSISTADGSAYLTALAGSTVVSNTATNTDSKLAQWYFISKNDRDKMLAAATALNPVDATYYVKQANPSRNLSAGALNENAWSQYNVGGSQDNSNFAAQVYNAAVDNYQIIENIPNGTYTVTVQAFTSGTDVKFYANDQEVDVKANDSGVTSCSAAAALFAQGLYPNTVTVTVTDRTLKIGFEGDCSGAKWLCWDNVEVYMTGYTANTGISAEIDNAEIEAGKTAQITAATVPATASFNAITYTSSDETVATVDENGQVTGLKIGSATITVAADEMEEFSTTVNVTVTAVTPSALAIYNGEEEVTEPVALDKENAEVTLTVVPDPADANASVTWESSDPTVATVADGVVTAISTGVATITVTSTVDAEVSATAIINVNFPETEIAEYTNDGATRYIHNYGENLIKNGTFEYPNGYYGWKSGNGGALADSNFDITTDGENKYLHAKQHNGKTGAGSIITEWPIENGKTYVFGYKVKAASAGNSGFHVVSMTNEIGTESAKVSVDETPVTTSWTDVKYEFTNTGDYAYVQLCARWLNSATDFDDFYLVEKIAADDEIGNVQYALDAIPTVNIGTAAFQYSQDAIDAANDLVQGEASVQDVEDAYAALTTINEPVADQLFNVILTYGGWTYDQKAMTYLAGDRNDMGRYNIKYQAAANTNLAQAFTFTKVSGNNYKMSQIDADGNVRYLSTGKAYEGGNTGQIRTTTDASKALVVTVIPTATEGKWNLKNTEADNYIGSQDAGVYTVNSHIDFNIVETTKPSITINTTAAGWGTVILPFAVAELPEGVKAYSVSNLKADQKELDLEEVNALEANKPYIIEGAWEDVLTGDAQGTALSYDDGMLTGVYTNTPAIVDTYVLQKQDDVVGFYQVETEGITTVKANHAYLTVPNAGVKAFFFGGETAIKSVFDGVAAGEIYDLNGTKVEKMQKGKAYIVNGTTVIVK